MPELEPLSATVIQCHATPAALDQLEWSERRVRIAPDELLLIGFRDKTDEIETSLSALDDTSLVIDMTCAYALWGLSGDDRDEAFRRVCAVPPPDPGDALRGLVADVPAIVIAERTRLILAFSVVASHHARRQLLRSCRGGTSSGSSSGGDDVR